MATKQRRITIRDIINIINSIEIPLFLNGYDVIKVKERLVSIV